MIVAAMALTTTLFLPLVAHTSDWGSAALTSNNCDDLYRIDAAWSYQWHPWPYQCDNVEMIPMIWSMQFWSATAAPSPWLLGFNEPDVTSQANMTPDEAAVGWHKLEQAYPYRMLVSPAPTSAEWLRQWRIAYVLRYNREPRISAIAGHVYKPELEAARQVLHEFAQLAREWYLPLWITEYAFPACWYTFGRDVSKAIETANAFTNELQATPEVARFAWFSSRDYSDALWPAHCLTGLYDQAGRATEYGKWFEIRWML